MDEKNEENVDSEVHNAVTGVLSDLKLDYTPSVIYYLEEVFLGTSMQCIKDAKLFSGHAKHNIIDDKDVKIVAAIHEDEETITSNSFEIKHVAEINGRELLSVASKGSLRLPANRHCLLGVNYVDFGLKRVHTLAKPNPKIDRKDR